MADLKLIGAVAVKVRPDAKGFRGDTKRQVLKELAGQEYDVAVNLELDTTGVKEKAKKAVAEVRKEAAKSVDLRFNLDYDSLGKAERQLDAALKKLEERTMKMTMDPASLAAHKAVIKSMRANSKVEMEVVDDAQGWQEQLNKIKQIQREKLVKKITFSTDDNELKRLANDLQNKLSASTGASVIPTPKISLSVSAERASLEKTLAQLDAELARFKEIKMDVLLTPESIERERKAIADRLANTPLNLKVNFDDQDSIKDASKKLQQMIRDAGLTDFPVDISTEEGLRKAKEKIDEFIREEDKQPIEVKPYVNATSLDIAAAQLKYATRDRQVNFFVNVNKKALAVAEGLIKSLSGLGVVTSVGQRLENLIVNFDKFSLKSAGWATLIGGLVNTITFLGTSMLTVGEGVVQSIGLFATLPTALAAVASVVAINVAAFKDFGAAIDGDAKALAALPPEARAAAKALQGTWTSIQKPVQKAFWEGMGDSIQRFAKNTIPVLRDGLTSVADDVGRFNAGILDSFEEIAKNGDMKKMFANLEGFFGQATAASKPFFDALNTFGLRGSDYLPRFGKFLADISTGFRDWATEADKAGRINVWIENGVQSLKDMGAVGVSVVDMFKGITRAVNDAGGGGLPEFRDNMRDIADIMLAEPFRSRMATIFAGARKGASELNKGVKDLGETIGSSAGYVNELLIGLGKLGGGILSGLATTLGQLQFQTGTLEGIRDMQVALTDLGPSFEGLGRIIGNMSRVSGEIFKGIAPVINTIVGFLDRSVGKLSGNLEKLAPALTGMVNALVTAATGPVGALVDGLNGLIGAFVGMPKPLQLATAAFATFLALRGPMGTFMTGLQASWGKLRGVNADGTREMTTLTATMARAAAESNIAIRKFDGSPMVKQLHTVGQKALAVSKQVGGSLMAFAGGPWGIALAAGGAALAALGDAAAKQKAKVDDLRTALGGQQGLNKATQDVIASQIHAKDSFLWMERDSVAQSAENIGLSLREIQKAAEGVPESIDKVHAALKKAADQRSGIEELGDTLKIAGQVGSLGPLSNFMQFLQFSDGANVGSGLKRIKDDLEKARVETEKFAKQLGVPVGVSAGIMAAIETLADKASTAEEKLRAVNDVIRQMNGDTTSDDAVQRSNDTLRDFGANLQKIVETAKTEGLGLPDLFDKTTGKILTVSASGSALRTELKKVADDGRDAALKLALAQSDPQKAIEVLRTEMQKTREKIAEPLRLAGIPPEEIEKILAQLNLEPAKIEMLLNPVSKEQALTDLRAADALAKSSLTPTVMELNGDKSKFDQVVAAAKASGVDFGLITPTPALNADPTKFDGIIATAKANGTNFDAKTYVPKLDADKDKFDTKVGGARTAGEAIGRAVWTAQVNATGNALSAVTSIWDTLRKIDGNVFKAGIEILGKVLGGAANGAVHDGRNWDSRFKPKFYANGGVENHVAQIAKPSSTLRVWAEPETGGEAYIPLASSKRARSTAILDEVADRFGYELYAKGGIRDKAGMGSAASGGGMSLHIDASPGVAYQYAREVATEATNKLRDMQVLYDIA